MVSTSPTHTNQHERFEPLLSFRGRNAPAAAITDPRASSRYISFIYGFPDADSLPNESVAAATQRALEKYGDWALQYGKTTGVSELIDTLLTKLQRDQGIIASPENLMITAGGSQAIQLLLDLLVDPGDVVIAEAPTWMGFIDALNNIGGKLVAVPTDEHGTDADALDALLHRLRSEGKTAKLIYLIPNFQNPSGVTTALERRERVAEIAARHGVLVLEDDAYHDLRFTGERIQPIYSLDKEGHTLYLGTLSKIMGAGMRLGWLVGPAAILFGVGGLALSGWAAYTHQGIAALTPVEPHPAALHQPAA